MGRLLNGLGPSLERHRRFSVQVLWIFTLLLVTVLQWWIFWGARVVTFTPVKFLWVLLPPSLLLLRAGILIGGNPDAVESYRDHFFENRIAFYSYGVISAVVAALSPWVLGNFPWLTFAPLHYTAAGLLIVSAAGLVARSVAGQKAVVALGLLNVAVGFYVTTLAGLGEP